MLQCLSAACGPEHPATVGASGMQAGHAGEGVDYSVVSILMFNLSPGPLGAVPLYGLGYFLWAYRLSLVLH